MDHRVKRSYEIIRKEFRQDLDLQVLAERVGLSPFHFHRLFKANLGKTPREVLNQTRLDRAAHLLILNDYTSLTEVSIDCGFKSLSSFSRAFSAHYRVPPKRFLESATLYKPEKKHDLSKLQVDITYRSGFALLYSSTVLSDEAIQAGYEQTSAFCSFYNIPITEQRVGVMTHEIATREHSYRAGFQLEGTIPNQHRERYLTVAEGYYASFYVRLSTSELWDFMINWKDAWLDKSPYVIAEPMAFEEVNSERKTSNSGGYWRRIFVPVRRRTARMVK